MLFFLAKQTFIFKIPIRLFNSRELNTQTLKLFVITNLVFANNLLDLLSTVFMFVNWFSKVLYLCYLTVVGV